MVVFRVLQDCSDSGEPVSATSDCGIQVVPPSEEGRISARSLLKIDSNDQSK
jgi:hypothetical protein